MLSIAMNHKIKLSIGMLMLLLASILTTIFSHSLLSDSISISFIVMLSFGVFIIFSFIVLDTINSICNP